MYVCACLTSSSMDRTSLQNSFSTVEKGTSYKAIKYMYQWTGTCI